MEKKELYSEYEKIYVGIKKNLPGSFFKENPDKAKENAIAIIKYAFEIMLGWTPEDISFSVNADILKTMHLNTLVKYLQIPEEFGSKIEPKYFAHILYPDKIYFDDSGIALNIYKRILSGENIGYPKKFFHDEKGIARAKVCLSYVLREKLIFSDIEEVYKYFLTPQGKADIHNFHLNAAFALFETPIDFVHQTLAESQKNDFLYHYYKFKYLYKKANK